MDFGMQSSNDEGCNIPVYFSFPVTLNVAHLCLYRVINCNHNIQLDVYYAGHQYGSKIPILEVNQYI